MLLLTIKGQFFLASILHNAGAIALNFAWAEPSKRKTPELDYASSLLQASAALNENSQSMWRLTAFVAAELNQPEMSRFALALSDQEWEDLLNRAEAYYFEKQSPEMLKWARVAQAGNPTTPITDVFGSAAAYFAEDWVTTIRLFPTDYHWKDHDLSPSTVASAWSMLGDAYRHQQQYDNALAAYKNALDADPTHYKALMWTGNLEWQLFRDQEAAFGLWRAAALSSPSSEWAYQRMGRHYVEINMLNEACQMAAYLLEINPGQSWAIELLRTTDDC
ncbi:MAG: tetratricopeptide repeat protein [Anaerolineales bacterium]|nr:tetratricopeptide repeat protein [Anaerolineales bacterium]